MGRIRVTVPCRTCTKTFRNYRSYKKYLAIDFNNRCGYCDDPDRYGGPETYHIDHFAPKRFINLISSYKNLVYSCPFCNKAKYNNWPSEFEDINVLNDKGFIDPCSTDYDNHLERSDDGNIVYLTPLGNYMFNTLHLYLLRHSIIYKMHKAHEEIQILKNREDISSQDRERLCELNELYVTLDEQLRP